MHIYNSNLGQAVDSLKYWNGFAINYLNEVKTISAGAVAIHSNEIRNIRIFAIRRLE